MDNFIFDNLIIIRGGGDIATGVVQKLFRSGFNILILEVEKPLAIRRTVSLSEAVYEEQIAIEDINCKLIKYLNEIQYCHKNNIVPILIDPFGNCIKELNPIAVIDCIIAKKNLGTNKKMAPITIGLGPGFIAGNDVDIVIETMRGHDLGRLIFSGSAIPNTGIPGEIGGKSSERVIHSPKNGILKHIKDIGDKVIKDEIIFYVDDCPVKARFDGLIRGLIRNNSNVNKGLKVCDVDPRTDVDIYTISDKARNIGGAVLESFLYLKKLLYMEGNK